MELTGRLCSTNEYATLTLAEGKISKSAPGLSNQAFGGKDIYLSPGFFDIQVNGYAGFDFNIGAWGTAEEVSHDPERIVERLALSGTALLCPTITTNSEANILEAFSTLARLMDTRSEFSSAIPGFHLEGPYLSSEDGPRGAHPLEHIRPPDWDEFQRFQAAAGGRIRLCTLAPELPGALGFIQKLVNSGVVVSIGHTAAEPETIREAVDSGATMSTHLGNGAHAFLKRHPNYLWEQLAEDRLFASVISDKHHLPGSVLKTFARTKGFEKIALISDAVSLGGLPAGRYAKGAYEVLSSGKVVTSGTPYLAGSGHLLDSCLANAIRETDLSLSEAIHCMTAVPAKILGLEGHKGCLDAGYDADITMFRRNLDQALEIVATYRAGKCAYQKPNFEI